MTTASYPSLLLMLATCVVLVLANCAPLKSSRLDLNDAGSLGTARVGHFYFLPRARLDVEGKIRDENYVITVARRLEADPVHRYFLEYQANALYSDTIHEFKVNERGLLTSIKSDTDDQTLEALKDVAAAALNVYEVASRLQGMPENTREDNRFLPDPLPFKVVFDPFDAGEVATASALAANSLVGFNVSVPATQNLKEQLPAQQVSPSGVFYHPPAAVRLELDLSQTRLRDHRHITLTVPNPHEVACYRFKRSSFVKREQSLTLVDGVPQETTLSKPSSAKALTGAVNAISGTVKDALPDLIKIRVDNKTNELNERERLLEQREAALQQRRSRSDSQVGSDDDYHGSIGPGG